MNNRQIRTITALRSALIYLQQHPLESPPPLLAAMQRRVETCLTRISRLHVEQHAAMNDRWTNVETLRKALRRKRMIPIVKIAAPLLKFAPATAAALRVPHARADAKTVADAGLQLGIVLAKHRRLLRAAGVEKTFVEDLKRESRQLALVSRSANRARVRSAHATAAMALEFKRAMEALGVIEGLLQYHGDPADFKEWRGRRRVSKRLGRPLQRKRATVEPST